MNTIQRLTKKKTLKYWILAADKKERKNRTLKEKKY